MPQLTVEQTMQIARGHHQAGRLAQAETLYRQILEEQPNHADALHLLGVIACQAGRYELAVDSPTSRAWSKKWSLPPSTTPPPSGISPC